MSELRSGSTSASVVAPTTSDTLSRAAEHWNRVTSAASTGRTRWWKVPQIVRHVNKRVCGEALDGFGAGLHAWIRTEVEGLPVQRGIAVGAGNGVKEMDLIDAGIVGHMDVYEIASSRVAQGRQLAAERGLADRITFHERALEPTEDQGLYDLVHWNNALHHMLDVDAWLAWSRRVLRPGGLLVMDDFIGASRFQWPKRQLKMASRYRRSLPPLLLADPADPSKRLPRKVRRPRLEAMLAADPTEAADSDRILPSLHRHFPEAEVRFTGGVIYSLALNDVVANFDPERDAWLLQQALFIDDLASELGENHYAVALAQVRAPSVPARLLSAAGGTALGRTIARRLPGVATRARAAVAPRNGAARVSGRSRRT